MFLVNLSFVHTHIECTLMNFEMNLICEQGWIRSIEIYAKGTFIWLKSNYFIQVFVFWITLFIDN